MEHLLARIVQEELKARGEGDIHGANAHALEQASQAESSGNSQYRGSTSVCDKLRVQNIQRLCHHRGYNARSYA
eukprot:scaffold3362_cov402-Prasinococcus_capsulatus_cf.AAC.6